MREHRVFAVALLVGVLVRVGAVLAFPPAFVFSDGPTYLSYSEHLTPSPDRVIGYSAFLRVVLWLDDHLVVVAVTQHLVGLATAVVGYLLLRRWGVSGRLATLGVLPVLLDGMQLSLEHSVLSDVLFDALLLVAVAVLAWSPRVTAVRAACAGLVLAACVLVRVSGEPVVLAAVAFCLLAAAGTTWRGRLVPVVLVVATFAGPLVGYAAWNHAETGTFGLSQAGGRALYMRTTGFVECDRVVVPDYQRRLCPSAPVGERRDPTLYGWHDPDGTHGLRPPAGVTVDQAFRQFATSAIRAQPGDYLRIVGRDAAMTFYPVRVDRYEYETAYKWSFGGWVDYRPTDYTRPAFEQHGGELLRTVQPWAGWLSAYGSVVYLWGPLLLVLLVVALVGCVWPRRSPLPGRPLVFLLLALGVGLVLVPDLTAQFTWRYTLPMVVLVPMAAALSTHRLLSAGRGRRRAPTGRTAG